MHAVCEMLAMHTQVKFSYQTEAGTLKFEVGKDGQRLLLGKGSFGKVPCCVLPRLQLLLLLCKAVDKSPRSCHQPDEEIQLCTR